MSVVKPNINELLINGFVRSIQSNLIHFKIIPVDVIHLCILFYSIQIRILISTNKFQNHDFMIAEFATKMITKLNIQKDIHKYGALFGCYIPNISSIIQCHPKNKTFDAILPFSRLSLHDNSNMDNCILLLESEKICVTDIVAPKLFVSKNKVTNLIHAKTIFCGKKHGIIYVDKHGLNQLKLENIKLNHNDHTFDFKNEEIQSNINEIFKLPGNYNSRRQMRQYYSEHYLSMRYLSNYNKIFAMQCYNDNGFPMLKHSPKMLSKESICGMFDFSNNKWIQIPNFKYKISENGLRSVYYLICQSPIKMADIFVLSNLNKTAKYDCNKHQWITYYDVESSFQKMDYYDLWFDIDPFVLYRCCKGCWKYNDVKFQYFDIRTRMKNVGWKELDATFITSGFASEKYTKIKTFIATNEYL